MTISHGDSSKSALLAQLSLKQQVDSDIQISE